MAIWGNCPEHAKDWIRAKAQKAIDDAVAEELRGSDPMRWATKPEEHFWSVHVKSYPHHPAGRHNGLSVDVDSIPFDEDDTQDGCGGCVSPRRDNVTWFYEECQAAPRHLKPLTPEEEAECKEHTEMTILAMKILGGTLNNIMAKAGQGDMMVDLSKLPETDLERKLLKGETA